MIKCDAHSFVSQFTKTPKNIKANLNKIAPKTLLSRTTEKTNLTPLEVAKKLNIQGTHAHQINLKDTTMPSNVRLNLNA